MCYVYESLLKSAQENEEPPHLWSLRTMGTLFFPLPIAFQLAPNEDDVAERRRPIDEAHYNHKNGAATAAAAERASSSDETL